jgi:putative transposase
MEFLENEQYHVYNRGNNQQRIFFNPGNYLYFLKKIRIHILPLCDILAYCLMPNHFHFQIYSDSRTIKTKKIGGKQKNILSEAFKILLSSYAHGINTQNATTGSLFQQNTKAKPLSESRLYDHNCFDYIHQNPIKANLVKKMEDWPYSSFRDYCGFTNKTLCNKQLAIQLLGLNMETFYKDSYRMINKDDINDIF